MEIAEQAVVGPSGRGTGTSWWAAHRPGWIVVAVVAGVAVQLVPLLVFPTVLTQDGPAHLDGAWVLTSHGDDDAVGALLREHYRIDLSPVPNMLTTVLLAGLMQFMGPDAAERLMVAALVVGLVTALGYAARGVDRRAGWLALAALPLSGSHLVAYGFYNFCWAVVGALVVLGLALRRPGGWSPRSVLVLAALLLGTWAAHLMPFAMAAAGVGTLAVARAGRELRNRTPGWVAVRRHVTPVLVAGVPSAVLTAAYLLSGEGPVATPVGVPSVARPAMLAAGIRPFVVGSMVEWPAAVAAAGALATLVVAALRSGPAPALGTPRGTAERWAIGALLVAVTAAYCLTPERLGTEFGFLDDRLAWFPVLLAVLWGATRLPGPGLSTIVGAVLLVSASMAVLVRLPGQATAARDVTELLSVADDLEPASTLVVLQYTSAAPSELGSPDPLRHESSRLAVRAACVDVGHYEAVHPYFQVAFAGERNLRSRLDPHGDGLERFPPAVDLPAVRGDLDYVLVVGLDRAAEPVRASSRTREVVDELAGHYERVAASAPTGLVTVWRATSPPTDGSTGSPSG